MNYEAIKEQERLLRFDRFTYDTGIEIGLKILNEAKREGQNLAVDVSICGHQIFHASLEGTTADNDEWLRKKKNTVYRFYQSSFAIQLKLKEEGKRLEDAFALSSADFTDAGGGFPIKVKGIGIIGAIVLTGTTQEDEHIRITSCLSDYLGILDCP
ncbi:heme-degrading domain-containing protein [Paenibacillus sp. NPDC058177]|uniref:heme-degrading domain-containing protein n=1 Tax=Paenibacillus sp. NPDC058177 TaxID=3346369 RepID=UPI0036D7A2A1